MKRVTKVPIFDGRDWSSVNLTPREAEAATTGEKNGFVAIDHETRRLRTLWFFWCETRNRPSISVVRKQKGRADVVLDLYCTDRCLTAAGWKAVVEAYARHGSRKMAAMDKRGMSLSDHAYGTVSLFAAHALARELLAIVGTGRFVQICHRPPETRRGRS